MSTPRPAWAGCPWSTCLLPRGFPGQCVSRLRLAFRKLSHPCWRTGAAKVMGAGLAAYARGRVKPVSGAPASSGYAQVMHRQI